MDGRRGLCKILGGLFGLAILMCVPGVALAQTTLPNCWDLTYAALRHRAAAPHPQYIAYAETEDLTIDGRRLSESRPQITYRDDGVVRIDDDGFIYLTRHAVPGPPELGPYGDRRSMWLPMEEAAVGDLPLIGSVRTGNRSLSCRNNGLEQYKDHLTYRLTFNTIHPERPSLKALWIDARTSEIWKVIVSGTVPVTLSDDDRTVPGLTDYEVELANFENYVVVDHVTWRYSFREFSQTADLFGEYRYSAFGFPKDVPPGFFDTQVSTTR
jgi:hypothetical protein